MAAKNVLILLIMSSFVQQPCSTNQLPTIKIASILNPLAIKPDEMTIDVGVFEKLFVELLTEALKVNYVTVPILSDDSVGFKSEKNWSGAIGMLRRKEIDIFVTPTGYDYRKYRVVDLSQPVYYDSLAIIMPYPREGLNADAIYMTFDWPTWLCLSITLIICFVAIWQLGLSDHYRSSLSAWSMHGFAFFLGQGVFYIHMVKKRLSISMVAGTLMLGAVVLTAAYQGVFTSLLTVPRYNFVVDSVEEAVANEKIDILTVSGISVDRFIMGARKGVWKKIGEQLDENPERRIAFSNLTEKDLSKYVRKNQVLLAASRIASSRAMEANTIHRKCLFTVSKKPSLRVGYGMLLRKDSYFTQQVNRKILLLHQHGLTDYAERRSFPDKKPCRVVKKRPTTYYVPWHIDDLSGAYFVLLAGYGMALVVFLVELIIHKIREPLEE